MKINLIGESFDTNSGQGIYRYSGELFNHLRKLGYNVVKNKKGDINHIQRPEIIWRALFKKNAVTTIHDLIPLVTKERKFLFKIFFALSLIITMVKSKKIIAISKSTKKDLVMFFPFSKKKIKVVYDGADTKKFYPKKNKKKKVFTAGYIGGLGKRKNVEFIIKLAKEFPEIIFKVAGKGKELNNLIKIKEKLQTKNLEFVGFIDDKKVPNFYRSLDLFIFPSLYEGFGLPVVEAMACGTPCLVSNKSSLPEIVGDAGATIDVSNIFSTSKKIRELLKNKRKITILTRKSLKRAKFFNWNKCAIQTAQVYKEIAK